MRPGSAMRWLVATTTGCWRRSRLRRSLGVRTPRRSLSPLFIAAGHRARRRHHSRGAGHGLICFLARLFPSACWRTRRTRSHQEGRSVAPEIHLPPKFLEPHPTPLRRRVEGRGRESALKSRAEVMLSDDDVEVPMTLQPSPGSRHGSPAELTRSRLASS